MFYSWKAKQIKTRRTRIFWFVGKSRSARLRHGSVHREKKVAFTNKSGLHPVYWVSEQGKKAKSMKIPFWVNPSSLALQHHRSWSWEFRLEDRVVHWFLLHFSALQFQLHYQIFCCSVRWTQQIANHWFLWFFSSQTDGISWSSSVSEIL